VGGALGVLLASAQEDCTRKPTFCEKAKARTMGRPERQKTAGKWGRNICGEITKIEKKQAGGNKTRR